MRACRCEGYTVRISSVDVTACVAAIKGESDGPNEGRPCEPGGTGVYNAMNAAGAANIYLINSGEAQEFTFEVGAISVESSRGGVLINTVPKNGGNRFAGTVSADFANSNISTMR